MKLKELMAVGVLLPAMGLAIGLPAGPVARAQQNDAGQRSARENAPTTRSAGGRGSRLDFQQAQLSRLKDLLGPTDEEWKVLEPRLVKIQDLLRDSGARNGIASARGRRGGFGGALPTDVAPSPVQQAARDLQESLANKDAAPDDMKAKLTALRDARARLQADLNRAQDQLREVLTARQEAVLVMAGMLN